jgi:hypothetical protein
LRILTKLFALTPFGTPPESIASGNYGTPPKAWWWFKQSIIYFIGLMGMKFCVLIIFLIAPWISRVGDWALRWTEGDEALQVVFVMLVFPVIMNATQYYIIDSFIKNRMPEHQLLSHEDDEGEDDYEDPRSGSSDEIHSGDEEDDAEVRAKAGVEETRDKSKGMGHKGRSGGSEDQISPPKVHQDYDPRFDGDSSTTIVGSASTRETDTTLTSGSGSVDGGKGLGR